MKKIIWLLSLFFCLILCSVSFAQTIQKWEFAGWYGGGCYPNIEFDSNTTGRVYLVSDVAGIYKSGDLGEHWRFINKGLENLIVAQIAIAPSNSNIIYAGTKKGLFLSQDAGQTWKACNQMAGKISFIRPANYRSVAILNSNPSTICIGTASGSVFYSQDYGSSWQILGNLEKPFGDTSPITAIMFGVKNEYLFVSSQKGIARYSFIAGKWAILQGGPLNAKDLFILKNKPKTIFAAGQNTLFISDDAGISWTQTAPIPRGIITRVSAFESTDVSFIAIGWEKGWNGGVLLSRDRGKTWISTDKTLVPDVISDPTRVWARSGGRTNAIKINPFNKNILFRTDWWGVFRSDDGGVTWNEKIKGTPNTVGSDIFINSMNEIYVATMDNGLLKSSDKGYSYKAIFPVSGYNKDLNGHVWRVAVFGAQDSNVIATSSPWGVDINQVLLSSDGGANFEVIRNGLPLKRPIINTMWGKGYPRALAIDPKNPNNIYLGIDGNDGGGLFVSHNGGRTWQHSAGQPASRRIYNALAVDPTDSKRIFWGTCGSGGGVYLSQDAGLTWKYVFKEMSYVFDMAISKEGVIYLAGDKGGPCLYISSDHGITWQILKKFPDTTGTAEAICIDQNNSKRIAVSTVQWNGSSGGKIYLSQDGGVNWIDITGNLPNGTGAASMTFNKKGTYLYISRYAGSVYRTLLSAIDLQVIYVTPSIQ